MDGANGLIVVGASDTSERTGRAATALAPSMRELRDVFKDVPAAARSRIDAVVDGFFAVMDRNAAKVTDFFKLPVNDVVEIGREVAI